MRLFLDENFHKDILIFNEYFKRNSNLVIINDERNKIFSRC